MRGWQKPIIIFISGLIGIILGMIFYQLNNRGVFINEFISGTINITDFCFFTFLIFVVIGIVVAAIKD